MVIHDLRNPANQIHFTVNHVIEALKALLDTWKIEVNTIKEEYQDVVKRY